MANQEEQAKKMGQLIAKCWSDDSFKQKLMSDPKSVLKENGVDIPEGLEVKMVENTDNVFHLVIPAKPDGLSDENLDKLGAGKPVLGMARIRCWADLTIGAFDV